MFIVIIVLFALKIYKSIANGLSNAIQFTSSSAVCFVNLYYFYICLSSFHSNYKTRNYIEKEMFGNSNGYFKFQCHKKCSFIFDCLKNQHRSERQQSNFANCHHYSAGLGLELKKWWNFVPTKWMPSNKKLVKFEINLFLTCKKHFKLMVNVSNHIFQEWYRTSAYTGILRDFRFSVTRKIAQN